MMAAIVVVVVVVLFLLWSQSREIRGAFCLFPEDKTGAATVKGWWLVAWGAWRLTSRKRMQFER
jgi:hypothetical protein